MFRALSGAILVSAALTLGGCDDSPTAPTTDTTVPVVTESFTGTLNIHGAFIHPFVVGTPGSVQATLVTSSADIPIGFSLGTYNLTTDSCQIIIANTSALEGRILLGTAQTSGAFCVYVQDVGNLSEPLSYEVQVAHQ